MKTVVRHTARWSILIAFLCLVSIAMIIGAARISLPFASAYRTQIQEYVSNYFGKSVELGSLDLSWQRFGPSLVLDDVVLVSGVGQDQDVHLQKVHLDLDLWRSWLNRAWQINEVVLHGANLSVEYLGDKILRVYGFEIDGSQPKKSENLDVLSWLMNADKVALLNSRVKFYYREKNLSLDMRDLNIRAVNTAQQHKIRLDVRLPGLSNDPLRIGADFIGDRASITESSGQFTLNMNNAELKAYSDFLSFLPLSVSGSGQLDLWGTWSEQQLQSLRVISDLKSPEFLNKSTHKRWHSDGLSADVSLQRDKQHTQLNLHRLKQTIGTRVVNIAQGTVKIQAQNSASWQADFFGPGLKLEDFSGLVDVLEGLPGLEKVVTAYQSGKPSGKLQNWHVNINKQASDFPDISAKADFFDLSSSAFNQYPGLQGLNGALLVRNNRGELDIDSHNLSLDIPLWFANTLHWDKFSGRVGFTYTESEVQVQTSMLSLSNQHIVGTAQAYFRKTSGEPLYMDIKADLPAANARFANLYYPVKRMKPKLVKWLNESVKGADLKNGSLEIRGPAKGFPYKNGEGFFRAEFDIDNGSMRFRPEWPGVHAVKAHVLFMGPSLIINTSAGESKGIRIKSATVTIADVKNPLLAVQSETSGNVTSFLDYIANSPLGPILGPAVNDSTGTGDLSLSLGLKIRLKKNQQRKPEIEGQLQFADSNWYSEPYKLDFKKVSGSLRFTENSLSSSGITAEYQGETVRLIANYNKDKPEIFSRVTVQGNVAANRVLQNYQIPIDHWFTGKAPWTLRLILLRPEDKEQGVIIALNATSFLRGTVLELPAPYEKIAITKKPVTISTTFNKSDLRTYWRFTYDQTLNGLAGIDRNTHLLQSLHIGFNKPVPDNQKLPDGVNVYGKLSQVSFDGWINELSKVIEKIPKAKNKRKLLAVNAQLQIEQLSVGKLGAGPTKLSSRTSEEFIHLSMDSDWLAGVMRYPRSYWDKQQAVSVGLSFLDKRFLDALATSDGRGDRIDPRVFPALDIGIEQFIWDELEVGDMQIRSKPALDGMKIDVLGFVHDHLQMVGDAHWQLRDPQGINDKISGHRTAVNFQIQSDDIGQGMSAIGIKDALGDGQGEVLVKLRWDDAAYAPTLDEIDGSIDINLKEGRILAVEPGAAKILGLFALQAIPRRLTLDFKDVTRDGLKYDKINGKINLGNGIAETELMVLDGPIGVITSSGTTDFISTTYSQSIIVLPRLSATLPIIGLLSGGAAAGVGVLLVDQVLKGLGVNFDEVGRREYKLSGSWDNPQFARVLTPQQETEIPDNR